MYIKNKNGILTDLTDRQFEGSTLANTSKNERNKILLKIEDISNKIEKLDRLFFEESQQPIEYNGHFYKFAWCEKFQNLLNTNLFPLKIWDTTSLDENAVMMDKPELQKLSDFLLKVKETAFQTKKETGNLLLNEKIELEKKLKG